MTDHDDLHDRLDRAAGPEPLTLDLDAVHQRVRSRRNRRRAGLAGLTAAVLLTVGVAAAGTGSGSSGQQVAASGEVGGDDAPASTGPTEPVPSTETTEAVDDATTPTIGTEPEVVVDDPTTTTAPETTTSIVTPDPTPPAIELAGTFDGTGPTWGIDSGRCPALAHRYDGTVTTDDGTWTLAEEYCGRLDGSDWSATGTFTLTDGAGDALTGTFVSRATLPTDGEPYQLVVTGGTGALAGTTGTCDLDNNVEEVSPGTNRQWGTISCALG